MVNVTTQSGHESKGFLKESERDKAVSKLHICLNLKTVFKNRFCIHVFLDGFAMKLS